MTYKGYDGLEKSEQEDFASTCSKRSLTPNDFYVALEESYPVEGIGHLTRNVFVTRCGLGEGKKYSAGSGTSWLIAFEDDLLAGNFEKHNN